MKNQNNAIFAVASRRTACIALLLTLTVQGVAFSQTQNWPNKPIRLIVPFSPGGGSDIAGRFIANGLSQRLGQPVVVENKPGASGIIGSDFAAKSAPDGYTLLIGHVGTLAMNSSLYEKVPYDIQKNFDPVGLVFSAPLVAVTAPSTGISSMSKLISRAKAMPGQINYSTSGAGTSAHITSEMINAASHVKITHIPYKGAAPALAAVLAGEVSFTFTSPALALPLVKAGKLLALAVTETHRNVQFPDVPTLAEAGITGVEFGDWYGVVAPAGTPKPILDKLSAELTDYLKDPQTKAQFEQRGLVPGTGGRDKFGALIKSETLKWSGVIKAANIKPE
ncbi:Bug family tripartite tricarboxylate transporter substrate binding protein [Polaromonas glacialis]|uniref:Bug family tripartite tricarboxylate transporter substrate binding protein n=1 Tax=Polaromonas glacialis TaxID=866564 RepID=UPI000A06B287|nr:tripartite tricarboxylate transporter substrate binding protein [Polaromonas glacialis]